VINVSASETMVFLNLAIFIGQIAAIYCYRKVERRKAGLVISTNIELTGSVSELVKTLQKVIQQNIINHAVARARVSEQEEDEVLG